MAARTGVLPPSLSAAPSTVVATLVDLILSGEILYHMLYSVTRIVVAALVGMSLGILVGAAAGSSRQIEAFTSPTLQLVAPVPAIAWMPLFIMLYGTGEVYKVSLAAFGIFLIAYLQTFRGIREVRQSFLELAAMYEKPAAVTALRILLPGALPSIFTALRLSLALAWILVFFVEYSSAREGTGGLGWYVSDARSVGRVEHEYAGLLAVAFLGFLVDLVVVAMQSRALRWSESADQHDSLG